MSDGGTFLQLSLSIRFSSNAGDTARWGLLPEVCKCVNAVALEMRRWAALCVCVCVCACVRVCVRTPLLFLLLLFLLLPSPSFFLCSLSPPCLRLFQSVMIISLPARSVLFSFSVWREEEEKSDGQVRLWMVVLLVKAECHCVHKSIASEVKA